MAEWYLFDGVDQLGPMERQDLEARIRRHLNPRTVRVWRYGFSEWKTVGEALDADPPSSSEPALPQRPGDSLGDSKGRNFVARHWRGEFPLGISYWVVGILSALVFVVALQNSQEVSFEVLFASFKAPLIVIILLAVGIGVLIGYIAPVVRRHRREERQHSA